ncbi:MAG TPA: hypothetical protein VKV26_10460 [Dehalococcoidia bacterium]|nr:hypothetical protein [Dehalococcoidia bacterium]
MLRQGRFIAIPGGPDNRFDHGAFEPASGRIFLAHTSAGGVAVLDHAAGRHERTLAGFPEAAGVAAAGGAVLVSNRGGASVTAIDARTLAIGGSYPTAARPNGIALAPRRRLAIAACLGDESQAPALQAIDLERGAMETLALPGSPRWCVVDRAEARVYCAIQRPSQVLAVRLDGFATESCWELPVDGAHGLDLDERGERLFVACDAGELVDLSVVDGSVHGRWPLPGPPDVTFFNPSSGLVHVAVKAPGVVVTIDPATGVRWSTETEARAGTTAIVPPDRLYVFMPQRGGALELIEGRSAA